MEENVGKSFKLRVTENRGACKGTTDVKSWRNSSTLCKENSGKS